MVQIYCIEDCNGLKYVGSTKQKINKRLNDHKCSKKYSSRELNLNDCKIYTLEQCDEEQRKEREQYWIDHTECVNMLNTITKQTKKLKYQLNYYHYQNSWGGDPRSHNNLLKIDLNIFL